MSSEAPENMQSAALHRSEAYLAETQRLTRTGSFAIEVATEAVTYSSAEHSRLYGFDPANGLPSMADFFARIHPDDRTMCMDVMSKGIREAADVEVEYRVLIPEGPPRIIHAFGHPVLSASGESVEIVGTIVDVTERREAEAHTARVAAEQAASGEKFRVLAEEQAALRRVATLVARGAAPEEVFAAVAEEVGRVLPIEYQHLGRFEPDGMVNYVAARGGLMPVGTRLPLGGDNVTTRVFETGRPARTDYSNPDSPIGAIAMERSIRWSVGAPIIVEGRRWGVMIVSSTLEQPPPPDTEHRLTLFMELLATAIANAESHAGLARLAEEQAALRRVATLVARGVPPEEVFTAVTDEVEQLLGLETAAMIRFEPDGTRTVVAISGRLTELFPVGQHVELGGKNVSTLVFETGRPARLNSYADASGSLGATLRENGMRQAVGAPIIVDGRLWGAMNAGSMADHPLPADTETRLVSFTELVATAVANAESSAALAASRARIVAAADESRRQIQRDLHDGAQQRLVHAVIGLKLACRALNDRDASATELVADALRDAEEANAELRELAHGILPAALTSAGLRGGLDVLVSRIPLPVTVHVSVERLPAGVEATAYFIVSEALTNVLKHARAKQAMVTISAEDRRLEVEICDDGIGGADPQRGSGLIGLSDRVEALGGTLELNSPTGRGTTLLIHLPVEEPASNQPAQP
jgi:signal transduction histidine kinase